jgi:ATP-dependent protease ClpP protease subunit
VTLAEKLDEVRDSGVDFAARRIFLLKDIDEESTEAFLTALHVLDSTDGVIFVTISSSGGNEPEGYAIYDALSLAKNKIIIEGFGQVSSVAAAIFQAGDVRRLSPTCEFMVHNGSRAVGDGPRDNNEIQRVAREIEFDNKRYREILMRGVYKNHGSDAGCFPTPTSSRSGATKKRTSPPRKPSPTVSRTRSSSARGSST